VNAGPRRVSRCSLLVCRLCVFSRPLLIYRSFLWVLTVFGFGECPNPKPHQRSRSGNTQFRKLSWILQSSRFRKRTSVDPWPNRSNTPFPPRLPSLQLKWILGQRDYASANRLRTDMIKHHVPITPNHTFIRPAIHAAHSQADSALTLKVKYSR